MNPPPTLEGDASSSPHLPQTTGGSSHPLFRAFEQLADAPGGVAKLRALIFELAATGRLGVGDEYCADEKLGDVGSFVMGQAPPGNECNGTGDGTLFVKAGEFGPLFPVREAWTTKPLKFAKDGDVLICVVGATAGKLNLGIDCAIGRSVAAIRPSERLRTKYLYYALMPYVLRLRRDSRGSAQGVIGKDDLANVRIRVPVIAAQEAIVAKVDELMALCDALEARQTTRSEARRRLHAATLHRLVEGDASSSPNGWSGRQCGDKAPPSTALRTHFDPLHATPDSIPALRDAIRHLAAEGRLVRQDAADEPASAFFARLTGEVQKADAELPEGWMLSRFESVALISGGVTLGRNLDGKKTVTLPYLRVANVKRGELDLAHLKAVAIGETELDRYSLQSNDLLLTEGGDWDKVGRTAIWRGEIPICLHQNHVFRARLRDTELTPEWFELYFNSPSGRRYFEGASKQTTNLASINMRQVRGCPVPIPPLAEQKRIVAKVEQLLARCDELETRLKDADAHRERLLTAAIHDVLSPAARLETAA